ncbi:MAG: M14 family metallopeptidase [Phycisphaerae bacterium]|jgi:hypothetical protein
MRQPADTECPNAARCPTAWLVPLLILTAITARATLADTPTETPPARDRQVIRIAHEHLDHAPHGWLDPCSFDPEGAVLFLTESETRTLDVPFERLGPLADHLRQFRPAKTIHAVGLPSVAKALGEPVEKSATAGLPPGTIHLSYDRYHTPAEGIDFFANLAQAFPENAELHSIGTSVEGRDIWALKITDDPQTVEPQEERILFCALHHAREWATHEFVLYLAEHLLTRYDTDMRIQHIVDNAVVWIVLAVNPDGFEYSWTDDRMWRKNRRDNGSGSYGVDINRNYDYMWGFDSIGSSSTRWDSSYRGPAPASEPETQAMQSLLESERPAIALSYHTYSQLVLYPWGYTDAVNAKAYTSLRAIADRYASTVKSVHGMTYVPGPTNYAIYPINGDLTDYAYGALGILAYTPELRPASSQLGGFLLPEEQILPNNEENLPIALWLMDNVASATVTEGPPTGSFTPGQNPFSLSMTPVNQKPELALGMTLTETGYLTTWLDDIDHAPPYFGTYPADFEGIGCGRGYRFEHTPGSDSWPAAFTGYKTLPYIFEDGAVVMIESASRDLDFVGVPATAPVRMRDIRIYQRRMQHTGNTYGYKEQVLLTRSALEDLHDASPLISWEWTHTAADGTVYTSHPEGADGADEFVYPHLSYAFASNFPSFWFGSQSEPVQLLVFPPALRGDADNDGDVDLLDHDRFADCMTGPVQQALDAPCKGFDTDHDFDVDADDAALFQREFRPAD